MNSETVFVSVVAIIAIVLCWISYLAFCLLLARKDANWSDDAAKIAKAFWKNVGRGIKVCSFDPRGQRGTKTPVDQSEEADDSTG